MKVHLIAQTQFNPMMAQEITGWAADVQSNMQGGEALMEFAGRACYQSWNKPNPATASNKDYLGNILDKRHYSVMEHAVLTFYITGVSRSLTHELIRHRHLSYSELSQRFVDSENSATVIPPGVLDDDVESLQILDALSRASKNAYKQLSDRLTLQGKKHKHVRETSRAVLPNMTETRIVVSGNVRAWRHFLEMRATEHADLEICRLAVEIGWQVKQAMPNAFQDLHLKILEDGRDVLYFGDHDET